MVNKLLNYERILALKIMSFVMSLYCLAKKKKASHTGLFDWLNIDFIRNDCYFLQYDAIQVLTYSAKMHFT